MECICCTAAERHSLLPQKYWEMGNAPEHRVSGSIHCDGNYRGTVVSTVLQICMVMKSSFCPPPLIQRQTCSAWMACLYFHGEEQADGISASANTGHYNLIVVYSDGDFLIKPWSSSPSASIHPLVFYKGSCTPCSSSPTSTEAATPSLADFLVSTSMISLRHREKKAWVSNSFCWALYLAPFNLGKIKWGICLLWNQSGNISLRSTSGIQVFLRLLPIPSGNVLIRLMDSMCFILDVIGPVPEARNNATIRNSTSNLQPL